MNRKRSLRKRILILSIWIIFGSSVVSVFFNQLVPKKISILSPLALVAGAEEINTPLGTAVQHELEGTKGKYAVVIKNLKTGESYAFNENTLYKSGSLYKLWVMAVAYQQIQAGQLNKDDILSQDIATLNKEFYISPDVAELTDGTITLSVHDALTQMITISHNYAAFLLAEKLHLSTIATFLQANGFSHSQVGTDGTEPITTASDIASFLEKLYRGKFANQQNTNEMITLLQQQQINDKLPKYLPQDVIVAHKTGELDSVTHDAGIIYEKNGTYIIVILSESDTPSLEEERIANISKAVYEYFDTKTN